MTPEEAREMKNKGLGEIITFPLYAGGEVFF